MARFLGSASGRTIGATTAEGFTKAKVFSTPGTDTFSVPTDVTKLKVFVVGAGSSYRTGTYAFCSDNCCSGVSYPKGCYCACFIGHLTGAGGGYAEKTFTSSDNISGKTLTINVGSVDGLSASSVSASGLTTVTATNATEVAYSWNCTSNSTARDNSNDNPISFGFCLPVCGYVNTFCGYYNKGGTSSGGDINRCGGNGVMIPQFLTDSYLDGIYCSASTAGASGNTSSCWRNPNILCMCLYGYHYTFGSCGASSWRGGCGCYYLCSQISNLCYCESDSTNTLSRYVYDGTCSSNKSSCSITGETSINGPTGVAFTTGSNINEEPIGLGAESGTSFENGRVGESEQMAVYARGFTRACGCTSGGGSCCLQVNYSHYSVGYDFSFGGTQFSCYCANYYPGCYSNCTSFKGTQFGETCYVYIGTTWTYVFGSGFSGAAHCWCMPYGTSQCSGTQLCDCRIKCIQVGFMNNVSSNRTSGYTIPLSTLISDTNTNINDIKYGNGATATEPAGYGGGGNRLNPTGGGGLVVVVY